MLKHLRRGVDGAIASRTGLSRGGQPLSRNRAPADDLAPWIARLYVTAVDAPADHFLESGLFNDISVIRIQLAGEWTAVTADGPQALGRAALVFGPHTHMMPVTVTGPFVSVGIQLRPGAGHALRGLDASQMVDRMAPAEAFGLPAEEVIAALDTCTTVDAVTAILEAAARRIVSECGGTEPDPITQHFELLAFRDPGAGVSAFAKQYGISTRQLERIIRRDFGLSPKQVLRRARALDMASHLRGVADEAEAEELALRYYDQSHLTRDFTELFGMSPRQFVESPTPLLTLALESRQARRLEAIGSLAPDAPRPWE